VPGSPAWKIRSGEHRYVTDKDLVEIIRKLARIEPDARVRSGSTLPPAKKIEPTVPGRNGYP
jgi:hypothetical protein